MTLFSAEIRNLGRARLRIRILIENVEFAAWNLYGSANRTIVKINLILYYLIRDNARTSRDGASKRDGYDATIESARASARAK